MSDTVYIATRNGGGRGDVYHTDPDCRLLANADRVHEWPRDSMERRRRECQVCAGDRNTGSEVGEGHLASLYAAARDREGSA